jgi:cytochrome c553
MMKRFVTILVAVVFLAIPLTLWSDHDGEQLYKTSCGACHGDTGEGNPGANMPALKGTSMSMEELANLITKGNSEKIFHANPMGGISEEQAAAIAKHIKTLE